MMISGAGRRFAWSAATSHSPITRGAAALGGRPGEGVLSGRQGEGVLSGRRRGGGDGGGRAGGRLAPIGTATERASVLGGERAEEIGTPGAVGPGTCAEVGTRDSRDLFFSFFFSWPTSSYPSWPTSSYPARFGWQRTCWCKQAGPLCQRPGRPRQPDWLKQAGPPTAQRRASREQRWEDPPP